MMRYSIEPRTRKYVKEYRFLSFARYLSNKYGKKLLDATTKSGLDPAESASEKVVHKTAEAAGELIGNKIAESIVKPKPLSVANSRNDEEIDIPPEKTEEIFKRIKTIIKMKHHKISKLLSDSTVSKFLTRKWTEVNDLSGGQYSANKNVRFKTPMLRSNLCAYSDTYIVEKGTITAEGNDNANRRNKNLNFKNNTPSRSCISKINDTFVCR